MPFLNIPTPEEIAARMIADVEESFGGEIDPTIKDQWALAFITSMANRFSDSYQFQLQRVDQDFPQTATGAQLRKWGDYQGLTPLAATVASGKMAIEGTAASNLPDATQYTNDGNVYETQGAQVAASVVFTISLLTSIGTTATARTLVDHGLATGVTVAIASASPGPYNGAFEITVISPDQFTYTLPATASSPASGAPTATFEGVFVDMVSIETGADQNLIAASPLTASSAVPGFQDTGFVDFDTISGGADAESDDEFRARTISSRSDPKSNFNVADIDEQAKKINGVTRVFVKEAFPEAGQVEIYFVRDNDDTTIIPDAGELTDVKNAIIATIYPAHSDVADLFVLAPTPTDTPFTFSAISPGTPTMQQAVENSLIAFFEDEIEFETAVTEDAYRAAIISTIDSAGEKLQSFTLSTPTTDISVGAGGLATLGTVTFV